MRFGVFLVLAGCASAPAPRVSVEEAMGWPSSHERVKGEPVEDPRASPSLAAAVAQFNETARVARASAVRGAPMAAAEAKAWGVVLTEVETWVALPDQRSSVLDAVRTRLQLEGEVEADVQTWGDVPGELADREQRVLKQLSVRLTSLTKAKPRAADPAKFRWPVDPVIVTSPFGDRTHPIFGDDRFHSGVDLGADDAQPVYAAETGTVVFAAWNGGHGKHVELQHDSHVTTGYSHLQTILVKVGTTVRRGAVLGLAGQTGRATGVHLHFELRKDGEPLDPEAELPSPPELPSMAAR